MAIFGDTMDIKTDYQEDIINDFLIICPLFKN